MRQVIVEVFGSRRKLQSQARQSIGKHGVTFYTPPAALEDIRTAIITQGVCGLVVSLLTLVATIYGLIGYYKKKHSSTSEALVKILISDDILQII